jgi:hypothetical protein
LEYGPENANDGPESHPCPASIYICTRSGKERASKVADDIQYSNEALVIRIDSEILVELRYGR